MAMSLGALAGAILGVSFKGWVEKRPSAKKPAQEAQASRASTPPEAIPNALENDAAMKYAQAFLAGDWDSVIAQTHWMQERLRRVQLESGNAEKVTAARAALKARLAERNIADNQLQSEGVEDQYVFCPGAVVEVTGVDRGRTDLGRPVAFRTWLRVTYPVRTQALRDADSVPIRSLAVGVNVTADGYVLKAGIIGNLDINRDSITYWTAAIGG